MIRSLSRQAIAARAGDAGQALPLVLVVLAAVLTLVFATVYLSHLGAEKVRAANGIDSLALSAATWEARCLNVISALNDGAMQCLRIIRYTCAVWAALGIAAAFGVGVPAFVAYSRQAPRIIRSYWNCARMLIAWSAKVMAAAPWIVIGETAALAGTLKAAGILLPNNPKGPHDGRNTLELHLKKGPPLRLIDALGPITGLVRKLEGMKDLTGAVRHVEGILEAALRTIVGKGLEPLRLLVPEEDFPRRQMVSFQGFIESVSLPFVFPIAGSRKPLASVATAQAYGGDATSMTWRSRLVPEGNKP